MRKKDSENIFSEITKIGDANRVITEVGVSMIEVGIPTAELIYESTVQEQVVAESQMRYG